MQYTLETEIAKSRDEVARLLADPEHYPKWQPGYQGREERDGQVFQKYLHGKRTMEMSVEVTKENLPEEHTIVYVTPGMTMEVNSVFHDLGDGKTRLVSSNTCTMKGFMKVMMWLMPGAAKKQSCKYLENFKAFAEDGTDIRESG